MHRSGTGVLSLLVVLTCITSVSCPGSGPGNPETPPRVLAVSPTGTIGSPGDQVQFQATIEGLVIAFNWQITGAVSPTSSTLATPQLDLLQPGPCSGTVTVSGPFGVSAPFPFTFAVGEPHAPTWQTFPVQSPGESASQVTAGVFQDRIVAIYSDINGGGSLVGHVRVAVSSTARPQTTGDWSTYDIGPEPSEVASRCKLVSNGGRPAVVLYYASDPDGGRLAQAQVPLPLGPADWAIWHLPHLPDGHKPLSVPLFSLSSGHPAMTAIGLDSMGRDLLYFGYATREPADADDAWKFVQIDMNGGNQTRMIAAELDGGISVAWGFGGAAESGYTPPLLLWYHSNSLTPTSPSDFHEVTHNYAPSGGTWDLLWFGSFIDGGNKASLIYTFSDTPNNQVSHRILVCPYPLSNAGVDSGLITFPTRQGTRLDTSLGARSFLWGDRIVGYAADDQTLSAFRALSQSPASVADFGTQPVITNRHLLGPSGSAVDLCQLSDGTLAILAGADSITNDAGHDPPHPLEIWYANGAW